MSSTCSENAPSLDPIYDNINLAFDEFILDSLRPKPASFEHGSIICSFDLPWSWVETKKRLKCLVNSKSKFFHVGNFLTVFKNDPDITEELLQLVASKASRLAVLTIKTEQYSEPIEIRDEISNVIRRMKSLVELQIHSFSFSIRQLTKMCELLNNLKILDVKIIYEEPTLLQIDSERTRRKFRMKFEKTFENLEVFKFTTLSSLGYNSVLEFQTKMTFYCIYLLLKLKFLGDPNIFVDMSCILKKQYHYSKLESLSIELKDPELVQYPWFLFFKFRRARTITLKFNDIEYRPVNESQKALTEIGNLDNICTLCLIDLPSSAYLEYFLAKFGSNLTKLFLTLNTKRLKTVRLAMIQHTCPKLNELRIRNLQTLEDDAVWSLRYFTKLKTIELAVDCSYQANCAHLSDILSAPMLEVVILVGLPLNKVDLDITAVMARRLRKLKKLLLSFDVMDLDEATLILLRSIQSTLLKVSPGIVLHFTCKNDVNAIPA